MSELEIYSDFNCTWCYFDKPSIKNLEKEYDVKIRWRAFPLHPDIPDDGMPIEALFGNNLFLMTDKMYQLESMASSLGLALAKRTKISNSRHAQELAKWAETKGKLSEFQDATYEAYFAKGLNIAEQSVLLEIAATCELPKNEAMEIIKTRVFGKSVDIDWDRSEDLQIIAAPTYLMNNMKLSGSQPYEKLEELMIKNNISKRQ